MKNRILKRSEHIVTRLNMNRSISIGKFSASETEVEYHIIENEGATLFSLVNGERNIESIFKEMELIYSKISVVYLSIMVKELLQKGIIEIKL